jgi:iron complex transport system substrate-binding protein
LESITVNKPAGDGARIRGWIGVCVACLALTWPIATAQAPFVDAARRNVQLPSRVTRVFAAGAPAEVLLYTLVPEMLVGRNRTSEGEALEFFPPAYRNPIFIKQLPEVDDPSADAELLALKPDVYIDYGTVQDDYIASVEAVQRRTRVPGIILDGALTLIPDTYRRLSAALGVADRGERLAATSDRIMTKYRNVLASGSTAPRVYLACSADGFMPCLEDDSAGEQLKWLGAVNVAGTRATAPRRPRTIDEIKALAPDAIVLTGGGGSAARLRANPVWQSLEAVAAGRVFQYPALPYGWGPRPPSVNRLPGVIWLSYVLRGRSFDAEFDADIRVFFRDFYHLELTDPQLRTLVATE